VSAVIVPVGFICVPRVLCEVWTSLCAMGTGCRLEPQVRVDFLCGHHGGVAVGPFPDDQVVEAFWKFESTTGCEEKTFPELGLFLKTCGKVDMKEYLVVEVRRWAEESSPRRQDALLTFPKTSNVAIVRCELQKGRF
jgi:hypothetical protein